MLRDDAATENRQSMPSCDKVLYVQVFGLIEVEQERYAFGFADTYVLPPDISAARLNEALRALGAEKIDRPPLEHP